MKGILLAFCGLLIFGANDVSSYFTVEKALNLNPKCAEGPTFWCTNLENAASCGALTHCIKTRSWPKFPVDSDSVCQICLDMVKEARDTLQSNETQEEIREVFEGTCALLRIKKIREICDKAADEYEAELVEMLSSQMNPQVVCSVAGLCNNAEIDRELALNPNAVAIKTKPTKTDGLSCKNCYTISNIITRKFSQTDRDTLLDNFLAMCGRMSSFSDGCAAIVLSYFNDIYSNLQQNLNADNICHLAGRCVGQFHQHDEDIEVVPLSQIGFVENLGDDIPCDFCKQLIVHLRDLLVANTTQAEFKQVLEGLCKQTKTFKDECLSIADQYYDELYKALTTDLDPDNACFMIGICPKGQRTVIPAPIMPLVPNKQLLVKKKLLGDGEPVFSEKEIQSFQLPKDVLLLDAAQVQSHVIQNKGSQFCTLCEYFLHFVQDALASPKNEEDIKNVVLNTCHKLPTAIQGQCQSFVETYSDAIIALLIQDIDPSQLCPKLNVCVQTKPQKDNEKCPLCLFLVQDLVDLIKRDRSKQNIEDKLHTLCNHLNNDLKAECVDFINNYTSELVDKLADDFTPREICLYLKLCTEKEEILIEHIGNKADFNDYMSNTVYQVEPVKSAPECLLCERLVKEVEKKVAKDKSKDHIKKVLEQACTTLPKEKLRNKCAAAIEKNTDFIVDLIIKEVTPKEVCTALGFCIVAQEEPTKIVEIIESSSDTPPCRLCQIIVAKVEEQLNNKTAQEDVEKCVKHVCITLPKKLQPKCRQLIDAYADEIVKHFPNSPPRKVCTDACICKPNEDEEDVKEVGKSVEDLEEASPECILCEEIVHKVEQKVKNDKSKDHIKDVLHQACDSFRKENLKEKCKEVVDKNIDYIIDSIVKDVSPKEICHGIGFCDGKKLNKVELVQFANQLMQKYSDTPQCVLCTIVMTKLEGDLKDKKTQDKIEAELHEICKSLPGKLSKACDDFEKNYLQLVISLVDTVPPREICGEMNMCRQNAKKDTAHRDVEECALCNTALDALGVVLDKHGPKDREIVTETTCHLLPAKYYQRCMDFMGIYVESLTNLIHASTKRSDICVEVGKCFRDGDNSMFVEMSQGLLTSVKSSESDESSLSDESVESHKQLLGSSKCTFGPAYWCSSKEAMNDCNAHKFCKERYLAKP